MENSVAEHQRSEASSPSSDPSNHAQVFHFLLLLLL